MNKQSSRQEVGYVLLDESEVLLHDGSACDDFHLGEWHAIDLQPAYDVKLEEGNSSAIPDAGTELVLRPHTCSKDSESSQRRFIFTNVRPFNGMICEVSVIQSSTRRRSDASLMLGLATEINQQADQFQNESDTVNDLHFRHLRVENVQIMFWETPSEQNDDLTELFNSEEIVENGDVRCSSSLKRRKASILVTFSLPADANSITIISSSAASKSKAKKLSSAHQLIASIIRCDWDRLDTNMKRLQQKSISGIKATTARKESKRPHFFPDLLNVEELYARIAGAAGHFDHAESSNDHKLANDIINKDMIEFLDLPKEIITTSIAPFLRAKSLHSLRVTNRKLFRSLRAVVPGLKLKLFHHQIRSLEWMELRERICITEEDLLRRQIDKITSECLHEGESVCGGDLYRAVTGGATVSLTARESKKAQKLMFDAETGCQLPLLDSSLARKTQCARGGLLCDDPGLGKTITVLSLILRSIGIRTETKLEPIVEDDGANLFYAYWQSSFLAEHIRKPAMLKLISNLIKFDPRSVWFVPPIDPLLDDCPDYFEVISNPTSLDAIRNKIDKTFDCRDFKTFEADVKSCFSNAMIYNPPGHPVYEAAEMLLKHFTELVHEFKNDQIDAAASSMYRHRGATGPSERSLVDAFEARRQRELQEPLVATSSTLLVVPAELIAHWQQQMMEHIDFSYVLERQCLPYIYYHSSKRNVIIPDASVSLDLGSIMEPLIFIDDGLKELPSPSVIARFSIVLTSHSRFKSEWKHGSLEQEVRASRTGGSGVYWGDDEPESSPFLKVAWLRVIVDEGHVMGKGTSNLIQFASWLCTERVLAMTGTPTKQIANKSKAANAKITDLPKSLYYLTNFLKHGFFNRRLGREQCWNDLISSGWQAGNMGSFFRLQNLLSFLMVRHTKADLIEIPTPIYSTTDVTMSPSETNTYNSIVSSIRTNIITTSMEGKTSGWQDSLLNPRQWKHARTALKNMRVACCGGTQVVPVIKQQHWDETLVMCRELHGLDDIQVDIVNNFIFRAQNGELSGCHHCGLQLQTLFVIPCGHLVCTECIDSRTTACPICNRIFDADDFQRLQPGLDLQFHLNLKDEKEKREQQEAFDREISVPSRLEGVIEVNGIREDGVDEAHPSRRTHKKGESCIFSSSSNDGKCLICLQEHFDCNFMNNERKCIVCHKISEECPNYASKSRYVIDKLLQLREDDSHGRSYVSPKSVRLFARNPGSSHRHLKAIVFSEFREIYEYFGDRLIRRFGGACVADYSYGGTRSQELHKFIHSLDCFVMLLSKQGSVGLDLSFVTHIFFLDSIFDKSVEAQVVARAYRMGAMGPVYVEELIAKDSIEEVMNQMVSGRESILVANSNEKHAKVHLLLKSAKLMRPHQCHKKKRKISESNLRTSSKQSSRLVGVRFQE